MNKLWNVLLCLQYILVFVLQTFVPTYFLFEILIGSISMLSGSQSMFPFDIFKISESYIRIIYISALIIPLISIFLFIQKYFLSEEHYFTSKTFVLVFYIVALSLIAIISNLGKLRLLQYELILTSVLVALYAIDSFLLKNLCSFHRSLFWKKYRQSMKLLFLTSIPTFLLILIITSIVINEFDWIMLSLMLLPYFTVLILLPLTIFISMIYVVDNRTIIIFVNRRAVLFLLISYTLMIGLTVLDSLVITNEKYWWFGIIFNSGALLIFALIIILMQNKKTRREGTVHAN